MPKPNREPSGRNSRNTFPESKAEVESYLSKKRETAKQETPKSAWSLLPESLQEIEERRQKQYQDLQAKKENIIPTATGNMDAERAGYNRALAEYGNYWGDKAAYDEGFAGYNAAMDRVRGQYASHEARHAETDKKMDAFLSKSAGMQGAENRMADADRRSIRDAALYNRMGKDANTAGDYALYQRAANGYNKTVSDYANNYGQAQSDYWNAAKTEQPGYYYAQTMSADEVNKKLEELYAIKEKLGQNQTRVYFDMDENPHTQEELQNLRATQARISERWNEIETEIAYYEAAQKMQKQQRGNDMYNYWLNEGGLEKPENYAKVEQGKAKYEADQTKASGGVREPEIATPAGGAIKAYRNRNQKENEWDNIFDNAPNLTPSDEMVFYALYADDPEQAIEWAYYINNRRNSEFQGEMAEWGHEHPGWAWLGGLGNRMISGVANFVDPNSAFAQKQSLQSTGLMSGGAQALNEWSGTIDTDIPIIKDLFNGKGAGDFYQLASSIAESGINMAVASYTGDAAKLVGALGTFIMGSSAAAADYNESLQRGLTTAQAQRHALAAGINEAAFEFISLDKVIKADKLAGQLKKVFVDAGIEASEEFCTTVANRVADGYLARQDGYDTQVEQRTKELIALGLSRAEAEAQAEKEWRVELINDAIGGFISGGFHSFIEWGGGKVANKIATNQNNEIAGVWTDADEIAALRAYADENGIKYNEKALQGMEAVETEESGRQSSVPTETRDGGTDSSPTAQNDNQNNNEEAAEKKRSRREARQERKSNRATGALQTQVEANLAKTLHESGLNNAQAVFEQTVSRYGEGITRTAQNAVANEARSVFGQAKNQTELNELYKQATENVTSEPIKQTIKEVYQSATTLRAYRGDNEALRDALVRPGNGGKLNLEAEITGKDGSTQQVRIASLDAERGKVKLDNGETVALNELQGLDADTKDVIERLDRFDLGDTRALAFHSYLLAAAKGDVTDGVSFVMEYALAYDQGRNGVVSLEKATEQSSLPADIVKEAYEHGARQTETWRKDQERRNAEKRAKAKDGATGRKGILDSSRVSQETLDKLSADKKDALKTFELLAEASGVDIRLIAQKADENGNVRGYQGLYNKDGNYIEIDINAGLNNIFKDLHTGMTAVLGHEMTHWMQENAPTEYLAYKKAVLKAIMSTKNGQLRLERMIEAQINQNKREGKEISRSQAEDEIVADASMKRLGDSEFWDAVADNLGEKKADVFAKIKEYISQFFNRVREIIGKASHTSEAAKLIDRVEADVQANLRRLYAEGIGAAMRSTSWQLEQDGQVHEMTNSNGTEVGIQDGEGHSVYSERTYEEGGRETMEKYLNGQVKKGNVTKTEMDQILQSVDEIYEASKEILDPHYKDWARAEVKRNIFGKPVFSWAKENTEYGKSMDASLICIKRRTLDAVFDYMIQNGMFDNFDMGQQSIVAINDIIRSKGFEIACGLCYIDAKRYRAAMVAGQFAKLYNELVKSMLPKGMAYEDIGYFNYGQNSGDDYKTKGKGLSAVPDSQINFTYIDKVIRENKPGDNSAGNVEYRTAVALKKNPSMRKLVTVSDFMSKTGFENVTGQNAELLKLYNAKKGTGGPKATEGDTQYLHDILAGGGRSFNPAKYFKVGGLRVQSFSDYIPRLVMDYAEMIGDMAAKKLPAHAYSKELMFALQFGMTGMKINMSLIPNLVQGGIAPGLDANGNYAWRDGQSFGSTVYGINESQAKFLARVLGEKVNGRLTAEQGFKLAQLIQNAEGYRDNCGTIAIGVSDQHIWKMLDDPAIRMIIPYHKSGLNHILASLLNVKGFTDYTNSQNTLKWDGEQWVKLSKDDKDFNFNEYMYTHKCDARTAAQAYLDWCEQKGFKPKFGGYSAKSASYNENADFTKSANYYKVLEDFNAYDAQSGAFLPQQAVKAVFPTADSAFGSMKDLMAMAIDGEALQQARQDAEVPEIVKDIQKTLPGLEATMRETTSDEEKISKYEAWRNKYGFGEQNVQFSTRSDTAYLEAVKRGDLETAQKMVDEAAKKAGYPIKAWHGTPIKGITSFDPKKIGSTTDDGLYGRGFYFSTNKVTADQYAKADGKTMPVYLKADNPWWSVAHKDKAKVAEALGMDESAFTYSGSGISSTVVVPTLFQAAQFSSHLAERGYDSIVVQHGSNDYEVVVFDPEQVKSADPVTYDDSGNVIPLSERFNPEKEDIRYSTRDTSLPSDLDLALSAADEISDGGKDEYWASLLESDPGIAGEAEEIKRLGKQLKKTEADLAEARRNLTLTDRKLKTRGIASLAATIMQDQKAGDINHNDVQKRITAVLTEAYQKALDQLDAGADVSDAWETVYQEGVVKAADILLTDATHSEKISYNWYTKTLGEYLGEGALEYVEADIAARVAQDFDANRYRPGQKATVADRLVAQAENRVNKKLDAAKTENAALKAENAKLSEEKAFYKEQAETAKATAGELYQQLLDKREELKNNKKISADERKATLKKLDNMTRQMQAKRREAEVWKSKSEIGWKAANKAVQEKQAAVDKLEKQLQREQDILSGKLKPPAIQKMLKAAREREAERVAQQKDERFAKYKERKEAAAIRNRIANLKAELQRRLTNPTDRSYVPAELATSMVDLLDALDTSPREGTQAAAKYQTVSEGLRALAEAYNSLTTDETVGWEYKSEYDEEIRDQIKDLAKTMQGRNIRELNLEELQQVYEAVKAIRDSMRQATKLLNTKRFQDIYEAIQSIVDQQKRMTPIADVGWKERNKRRRLLEGLSVMRAVEMMSGWERDSALYSMFQGVEQGQVDADNWIMGYDKAMRPLKTGKNEKAYRDALTKQMDFGATDKESGKTVKMTKLQAIQLYMTWQREQANDKLVHLQKGGATIRDALAIQNGNGSKAASHTVRVTPELIANIENSLTEWDRAYMKEIRGYLDKEAKAVNRVLYALKHRVLTTEAAYMPYVVDKGYLETKLEGSDVFNLFVKTPGSTQALQKKAPQPVIIDGLDNMMARHVRDQAQYIGLALPIRDFAKVFNGRLSSEDGDVYTSLKKTIEDNFEAGGTHLLVQALLDIQNSGAGEAWKSQIAAALNRLHSSFVKAALLINPSVTIKQAASYIAAESVLSHTALERGNHPIWTSTDKSKAFMPGGLIAHLFNSPEGRTAQRLYDEIDAHTSMHYIRRQGMSHAELANEAQRDGRIKRATNALGARMEKNKAGHIARKAGEMLNPLTWIQRMDVATTATLWVACKEQAKLDGIKTGTAEYWNRVTELYERCLRETQPMYDGLHRTAHQKQGGGLMQYLFPFRTVPIQNHGQIVAAYETMKAMKGQSKEKQAAAKKFFAKTVWAQTQSAVVFSLMTFLAAALKRKTKKYRDDDEEFTLESFLEGLGGDTASTLFSVAFPMWGSEAWNIGSRIFDKIEGTSGYSYDAFTVGAVDMLNELATAGDKLFADIGKKARGENVVLSDVLNDVLNILTKGAKIAGIPADTVKTYYAGIKANVQDAIEGRVPALNDETWERSAAVNARRLIKALEAGDEAKAEAVMEEMRQNILKEKPNLKADKVNAKIQSAVQSYVKQQYLDNEMSEEKAIHYMVEYGSADDENDAFWKIREWEAREAWDGEADDFSFSKYTTLREIIDNVGDISEEMQYLQDHGVKFEDANKEIKGYIGKQLKAGEYDEDEAMKTLQAYHKVKDEKTKQYRPDTEDEAWLAVKEWKANAEHANDEDYSWNKYEDLFAAMDKGGDIEPHADELESHGIKNDSIKNAVVDHVKERYEAGEVNASEAMRLLQKYRGMDANEAYWKVDEWDAKEAAYNAGEEFTNSNYRDLYAAIDANKDASAAIRELTEHGYKKSAVTEATKTYLKKQLEEGTINETQFRNKIAHYLGITKTEDGDVLVKEVSNAKRYKEMQKKYPNLDIDDDTANRYYDGTKHTTAVNAKTAEKAGLSIEAYIKARAVLKDVKGYDNNGDGKSDQYSREKMFIQALNGMNLTAAQKWALYYEEYEGKNWRYVSRPSW